jgi:hypothetical protein
MEIQGKQALKVEFGVRGGRLAVIVPCGFDNIPPAKGVIYRLTHDGGFVYSNTPRHGEELVYYPKSVDDVGRVCALVAMEAGF